MYRKEAPWESAQKELLKINAYKVITSFIDLEWRSYDLRWNL